MAMRILSRGTMVCEHCGGYAFPGQMKDGKLIVRHPTADDLADSPALARMFADCPLQGKVFTYPEAEELKPVEVSP